VNGNWEVLVDGRVVGELDSLDFTAVCGSAAPTAQTEPVRCPGRSTRTAQTRSA
jgi:hypothetical protein